MFAAWLLFHAKRAPSELTVSFCTSCGAGLETDHQFCHRCGAAAGEKPPGAVPRADPDIAGGGWTETAQPTRRPVGRIVLVAGVIAAIAAVAVSRLTSEDSCTEVAREWADLADRVGPSGIDQVRIDARREISNDEHREAVRIAINLVPLYQSYGDGGPIPNIQLDSLAGNACSSEP